MLSLSFNLESNRWNPGMQFGANILHYKDSRIPSKSIIKKPYRGTEVTMESSGVGVNDKMSLFCVLILATFTGQYSALRRQVHTMSVFGVF